MRQEDFKRENLQAQENKTGSFVLWFRRHYGWLGLVIWASGFVRRCITSARRELNGLVSLAEMERGQG